jgi:hypothetical protein
MFEFTLLILYTRLCKKKNKQDQPKQEQNLDQPSTQLKNLKERDHLNRYNPIKNNYLLG